MKENTKKQSSNMITMKINFEYKEKVISSSLISGDEGLIVDIRSKVPWGYFLASSEPTCYVLNSILTEGVFIKLVELKEKQSNSIPNPNNRINESSTNVNKPVQDSVIKNTIHFVNLNDQEVSRLTIQGSNKDKVRINPPQGYKFTSQYWNFIVLSKDTIEQKAYVVPIQGQTPPTPNPRSVEPKMEAQKQSSQASQKAVHFNPASRVSHFTNRHKYSGHVTTFSKSSEIPVINSQGQITYTLTNNYDFHVSQIAKYNNEVYCQIGNDAWIKASNVFTYKPNLTKITLTKKHSVKLRDCRGEVMARRDLEPGTTWYTDRMMKINDKPYYRVTSSSWVNGDDVDEVQE
jgi:hypothetical protein